MNNLKLGVDVVSAHDLMPKDGQGSSSAYVELFFDGQKFRTTIKERDLNPVWDESFYFNISDPTILPHLTLDAYIYNTNRATNSKSFLGKVSINGTSFVPHSDAVVFHYPLEKRGIFSRIKGEIGLKVYITNDPTIKSSTPMPSSETNVHAHQHKSEVRHTFHHLPNPNNPQPHSHPNGQHNHHDHQQHHHGPEEVPHHHATYQEVEDMKMKPNAPPPKIVRMHSVSGAQPVDFALKETSPYLGGGRVIGGKIVHADKTASTYDLVERDRKSVV